MIDAPKPKNQKELASFSGLVTFYARFLKNRSEKFKPLCDALNNEKFEWSNECSKAFEWVKDELISPRVLAQNDPKEQMILACDASDRGISAILSHKYCDAVFF